MMNKAKPKTLHILFTGLFTPDVLSGGDQLILDIVPRLPKSLKITIVMPSFAKKHWDKCGKMPNVTFKLLPPNRFENKTNPFAIFTAYIVRAYQVYRYLRHESVQTIYSCSDIAYADIWPAYWLLRSRPDVRWLSRVYHVLLPPKKRQGSFITNATAYRLQRLSFWMMKRRSSTIFALNPKLYDELLGLGFPKRSLSVLGAGIDFKQINTFKPTKRHHYDVVSMGRVAPVKGIFDSIEIWKKVHDAYPDYNLGWIGSTAGGFEDKVKQKLKKASATDSFHLLGFVDKDEAYEILQSAKVFICPDHENGWGLAVCEAMASGLPVVSYDLDIFGSVYQKGFKSVPLFDTSSFADELIKLLQNEKTRKKLAKEAMAQAEVFDHQKVIDVLVKHID